jgi:putative spermidine/putrescine transport system ATP-binding protein
MRAEIRRIHNTLGSTTIYVTHDQEEALSLADRIVVMRDGQVRQVGTPEDLFWRPRFLDVAEFMGFRNRIRGRVVSVEGESATIQSGDARITGRSGGALTVGAPAVAAVRTEDLVAADTGASAGPGLAVSILSTEFRGQEFVAFGRSPDGTDLSFRVAQRLAPGTAARVAAEPARVVVFAETAA